MSIEIAYIFIGCLSGLLMGVSGMGGGAFTTPLLILLGVEPVMAVGTDLLFSFCTKLAAMKNLKNNINWSIVKRLCIGSIPASIITSLFIYKVIYDKHLINSIIKSGLGYMLLLSALILISNNLQNRKLFHLPKSFILLAAWLRLHKKVFIIISGVFLGFTVTFSSIGAGSFGMTLLLFFYREKPLIQLVASDITQAIFLTMAASLGYQFNNNIDYFLLCLLLIGSVPCVILSSHYLKRGPEALLRNVLAMFLFIIGLKILL